MRALLAGLLVLSLFAGCLSAPADELTAASVTVGTPYPYDAAFDTADVWSHTLVDGSYAILEPEVIAMPSFDGTVIHMGVFRPDVPKDTKVPVIIDAGPYYLDGDEGVDSAQTHRLGGFLIENFVPHGYAVAQVSIRGTGLSGGCVDYMGEKEQRDLDAAVTFLGEQEWSNGNVGMIGRSYDGSTPYEAATFGNPYLKTIVPISGISDLQQLHYRNGTSEGRALFLGTLYYTYAGTNGGVGGAEEDPTNVLRAACLEGPQHTPMGAAGYATGGGRGVPGPLDSYWSTRSFTGRVLENYEGSIFYVHGLQDWNVKPSQGVDVYNAFEGKKKALLGQWAHNYPDRPDEHEHLRWDWAEMLLRWFDSELKGLDVDTGPAVEIEDHRGNWRAEPANAWPPTDAEWRSLYPSADGTLVESGAEGQMAMFAPAPSAVASVDSVPQLGERLLTWESAVLPTETRISGQPLLHVTVNALGPGGNLWAELYEKTAEGDLLQIGRAQMDLRYANGGTEPAPYVSGTPTVAKMQFYPLDARLLAGSSLVLVLTGETASLDQLPNPATSSMTVTLGDDVTSLHLPIVEREFRESRWDVEEGKVLDETA